MILEFSSKNVLLQEEDLDEIRENVESTNQNRAPSKYIGDYAILELLGSGAFGVVYKVQKKSVAQSYFAMKEVRDILYQMPYLVTDNTSTHLK